MNALRMVLRGSLRPNGVKPLTPIRLKGCKKDEPVKDAVNEYKKGPCSSIASSPCAKPNHFVKMKMPTATEVEASVAQCLKHFRHQSREASSLTPENYHMPHPIWDETEINSVKITHEPIKDGIDKLAYIHIQTLKKVFDLFSGFMFGQRTEKKWLNRISFLETVAAVPGMVGAMMRHLQSLRYMRKDNGWIHTLLEEAENERLHLLTALELRQPSLVFRVTVIVTQIGFVTWFSLWYMISPRFCHRLVGYLEEEAVKTYTQCLEDIESGTMQQWKVQIAPELAIKYWQLKENGTMKDVILAIRADEAHHRIVNHTLASLGLTQPNPYLPGK